MAEGERKSIMRSLGEFFGHIGGALRADPAKRDAKATREVRRTVEETQREDGVILRRTTIEEVELRGDAAKRPPSEPER